MRRYLGKGEEKDIKGGEEEHVRHQNIPCLKVLR